MQKRELILSDHDLLAILRLIDNKREWFRRNRNRDESVADILELDELTQKVKAQLEIKPRSWTARQPKLKLEGRCWVPDVSSYYKFTKFRASRQTSFFQAVMTFFKQPFSYSCEQAGDEITTWNTSMIFCRLSKKAVPNFYCHTFSNPAVIQLKIRRFKAPPSCQQSVIFQEFDCIRGIVR